MSNQKSKVAGLRIFRENTKREAIAATWIRLDIRFGSLADSATTPHHIRFTPDFAGDFSEKSLVFIVRSPRSENCGPIRIISIALPKSPVSLT